MATDPKTKKVRVPTSNGGEMIMPMGMANYLGFTFEGVWPPTPTGRRKRVGGTSHKGKAVGKVLYIKFKNGDRYSIRYTGTFRDAYSIIRGTTKFSEMAEVATLRRGSVASEMDQLLAE